MKRYFFTAACWLLGGALSAQQTGKGLAGSDRAGSDRAVTTDSARLKADSLRQQKELDEWVRPVRSQLDSVKNAWLEYSKQHFDTVTRKFDTSGLGRVRAVTSGLHKEEREKLNEFARLHPDYLISIKALNEALLPVPDDIRVTERIFKGMDQKVRELPAGRKLEQTIGGFSKVAVGHMAPEFSAPDTSGNVVSLSSYRGKYVLLDFWASWCGPCREENPNVVAAYAKFHDRNFEILSVSLDQPGKRANWVRAIQEDKLPWQQVSDLKFWNSEIAKLYSIWSIPQNFLIDPKGKIIAVNLRGEDLSRTLGRLL